MKTNRKPSRVRVAVLLAAFSIAMSVVASAEKDPAVKDGAAAPAKTVEKDPVAAAVALPEAPVPDAAMTSSDASSPGQNFESSKLESSVGDAAEGQQAATKPAQPQIAGLGGWLYPSYTNKYSTVVQPDRAFSPFSPGEKLLYSMRESVTWGQLTLVVFDAGFNHLISGDPRYGSDSGAFAARIGAIAVRQASMHIISDGIYASVFRQDERYFRKGPGTPVRGRIKYVLTSIFLTQGNNGNTQVDASGLLGRATGSALTMAYYPKISANGSVAARTFGYSLLGEMSANAYLEFWPDVWLHLFHGRSK